MLKKFIALLLCLIFAAGSLAGCGNKPAATEKPAASATAPATTDGGGFTDLTGLIGKVSDSSDLPDWTGKTLTLSHWYGHGSGDTKYHKASDDVYWPEIKRAFGIEFDIAKSFDNGGMDYETKLTTLAATGDWPNTGHSVTANSDLVDEGLLYDLTDLLPVYMPNYWAFINKNQPNGTKNGFRNSGRIYCVNWFNNNSKDMMIYYPDIDMDRYQYANKPYEWSFPLYVRDDILKLIYPEAKSQQEIEDLFMEQGYFTREQVYDVPIKSKQDAVDFLYKVRDVIAENNITEGGRPVNTIYMSYGFDLWPLMMYFFAPLQGMSPDNWNYFTTFNDKTKKFERQFATDFFKGEMRLFNQLVRDGVGAEESLIDTTEIFENKMRNGEYAVCYTWWYPNNEDLKAMGKTYQYRKVYFDMPEDVSTYLNYQIEYDINTGGFVIFKTVAEEDVPQILQYLDFLFTDAGMRLQVWGPRSAGLFTEDANGLRKYTDPELEACMVFGANNDMDLKYNLSSGIEGVEWERWFPPQFPQIHVGFRKAGILNPIYNDYDMTKAERQPEGYVSFFSSALYQKQTLFAPAPGRTPWPWSFFDVVPELDQWWGARDGWENDAMIRIMAARSDEEFEQYFDRMIQMCEDAGFTEEVLDKMEQALKDNAPEDWAAYMGAVPIN